MNDRKKRLMTIREVAERLGVKPITLYRLLWADKISRGVIQTPTGRYRIDFDELLEELKAWTEYLRGKRRGGRPSASRREA